MQAPQTADVTDWFKEVTLFKRNPSAGGDRRHFVAYTNGKSAVRLAAGVVPAGPHRFTSLPPARILQSVAVTERSDEAECCETGAAGEPQHRHRHQRFPVLLHFVNCGFEEWCRKYRSLGSFGDTFCGATKVPFDFHLKSRDAVRDLPPLSAAPTAGSEQERARQLYESRVVYGADKEAAVASGLACGEFVRTAAVASIVQSLVCRSCSADRCADRESAPCPPDNNKMQ
eukprot:SAG31_NODE_396_length_16264_cov_17.206496_6_plen_229_part_00